TPLPPHDAPPISGHESARAAATRIRTSTDFTGGRCLPAVPAGLYRPLWRGTSHAPPVRVHLASLASAPSPVRHERRPRRLCPEDHLRSEGLRDPTSSPSRFILPETPRHHPNSKPETSSDRQAQVTGHHAPPTKHQARSTEHHARSPKPQAPSPKPQPSTPEILLTYAPALSRNMTLEPGTSKSKVPDDRRRGPALPLCLPSA